MARGEWVDPAAGAVTVERWAAGWVETRHDLRTTTLARLRTTLAEQVIPAFGTRKLSSLTNSEIRAWVAMLATEGRWRASWTGRRNAQRSRTLPTRKDAERFLATVPNPVGVQPEGLSAATIRKAVFALRAMLDAAVADRRISANPATSVPLPAERQEEQRFLTREQLAALADAVLAQYRALVLLGGYGGMRWGEMAGLRRSRVDVLRGRVTVAETAVDIGNEVTFGPPKTPRSRRTVPVARSVMREIEAHLAAYTAPREDALVFTSATGLPLRRGTFRREVWLPATRAVGVEGLRVHDLRHTYVALMIQAGANPKEVSTWAGHSSVAFTLDRYGHLYDGHEDDVADRLDALLASTTPSAVVRPISRREAVR